MSEVVIVEVKMYKCDLCGNLTKDLYHHKYTKHGIRISGQLAGYKKMDKKLPCMYPGCDLTLPNKDKLRKHRKEVHGLKFPNTVCQTCRLPASGAHCAVCTGNIVQCIACRFAIIAEQSSIYAHMHKQHGYIGEKGKNNVGKVSYIDKVTGKRVYINENIRITYTIGGWSMSYTLRQWKLYARRIKSYPIKTEDNRCFVSAIVLFRDEYLRKETT